MEDNITKDKTPTLKGLQVDVTNEIIETALPANSGHCMVSDAVSAACKRKKMKIGKVLTDLQTIRFTDLKKKCRIICFTPRVGQLALLAFDQGVRPKPFSMRIKPVQIIESKHRAPKVAGKTGTVPKPKIKSPANRSGLVKMGGHALPTTVGLRREFGLRQMGVYQPA